MASLTHLKKRLSGIKSINQITAAMELVAATKMRKAQEVALGTRSYAWSALELLSHIIKSLEEHAPEGLSNIPLLMKREIKKTAIVVVTSDKGLVGSFNSSVLRRLEKFLKEETNPSNWGNVTFITIGQKGADYVRKRGGTLYRTFTNYSDLARLDEISELTSVIVNGYLDGTWDEVLVFSANFISALRQEAIMRELLPMDFKRVKNSIREVVPETGRYSDLKREMLESSEGRPFDYVIEPSPRIALEKLLPHLLRIQVYTIMLEANASEHSARRVAMKNASDNAGELINNLTLLYNRSRQELITKELTEITSTVAAINPTGN